MPLLVVPRATPAQSQFLPMWRGTARWSIEFSPTTAPGTTPIWQDITSDVRSVQISRGKQRQLDRFETGTCRIVLDNRDRKYDPQYSGSPFWNGSRSNVTPMRMFRVRGQYGDATYYRFVGFATAYKQEYDISDREAVCVVELEDAFKIFNLTNPSSPFSGYIQTTRPSLWFRLGEQGTTTTMADSSGYARNGSFVNTPTLGATGLIQGDDNTAVTFDRTQSEYGVCTTFPYPSSQLGFSIWFKTTSANAQTLVCLARQDRGLVRYAIELTAAGQLRFVVHLPAYGVHAIYTTTDLYNDGNVHHVFGTTEISQNEINLWTVGIDGTIREYSQANLTFAAESSYVSTAGQLFVGQRGDGTTYFDGTLDEFTAYIDTSFSLAQLRTNLLGIYETATTRNNGQPTGVHINAVLDNCEWPQNDRDIDTGNSTLQADDYTNATALDLLQHMAETEQGLLFMGQDGRVVFRERRATNAALGIAAYTTDDPASGVRFSGLTFSYDESLLYNTVTAGRRGGGQVTVADQDSVDRYLVRTYEATDLLYDTDGQAQDFASWIVNRFGEPSLRVERMDVMPERDPSVLYPMVLALELGSLVQVVRTPQGIGDPITTEVSVVGSEETITPDMYQISFTIAEADTSAYWVLEDDVYGVLDKTTRLAF